MTPIRQVGHDHKIEIFPRSVFELSIHPAAHDLLHGLPGCHSQIENFIFLNGFSGHGLQQSPAMGRGTSEWLTYGEYRTLDLRPFHYDRVVRNEPIVERAII